MEGAFTLLNPGPINVSEAVRAALANSLDQCHREPEYLAMQTRLRAKLGEAFGTTDTHEVALVTGSGTAGMEAMVASVIGKGAAIVDNGVYGDRLMRMAAAHKIHATRVHGDWFARPDLDAVAAALTDEVDTLAVVHHETTTGLINDLPALADVARAHGKRLVVDSISGLAGEALDWARVAPDALCCTANKCVQGLPGVSFVFVKHGTALEQRSVYLDLATLLAKQRDGNTPFTPAIQVTAALEVATDELIEETVDGRIARYARASGVLRGVIEDLGMKLLLPAELRSNTITCASLPEGVGYPQLHDRMREHGFVIYAGQGDLSKHAWRVANMGLIPDERLEAFGPALEASIG